LSEAKRRDCSANAFVEPNRGLTAEPKQTGRPGRAGLVVLETKQRWVRLQYRGDAFGEFSHRMRAADGDVPGRDTTLLIAIASARKVVAWLRELLCRLLIQLWRTFACPAHINSAS
jgi:hypothetical protein